MKISATASNEAVEPDRTDHALCALTGALSLIAGKCIRIPKQAYPYTAPSSSPGSCRLEMAHVNCFCRLAEKRVMVSGENLAYREGEIEYFTGHIFRHWWRSAESSSHFLS